MDCCGAKSKLHDVFSSSNILYIYLVALIKAFESLTSTGLMPYALAETKSGLHLAHVSSLLVSELSAVDDEGILEMT
jgi:hypothetical protein